MAGLSPKEYILSQLTIEAKRMAMFSNLSVKEIGYSLGFEDASHFSRFFKQQTGLSFNDLRRSL
jgi:AraC-like DNA-binding protein